MESTIEEVLAVFKALADATRLKIIGLLSQHEYSVEQIADIIGVSASTISHHLGKLAAVELVSSRTESYYNLYSLKTEALDTLSQRLLSREILPEVTPDIDLDAYDKKVLKTFCDAEGRLRGIPAQRKKLRVLLHYVADKAFKPGVLYSKNEVNDSLTWFYAHDIATLRRSLIANKIMNRTDDGNRYWLIEEKPETARV